jgi:NhaA family Na+:H+ antiporter
LNQKNPVKGVVSTFGAVARPIQQFFRLEAASGILLFTAAIAALVWANSPGKGAYHAFFGRKLTTAIGEVGVSFSLHALINEGLMSVFFLLVGMEIKRELVAGELSTVRRALLPAIAALGGMLVPSAVFLAFNVGGPGQAGWGIPMATDIAFAIGCLTLLRKRVPHALLVYLTALAIFDDVGGILVIAFFYGHGVQWTWLLTAGLVTLFLLAMNRTYARSGLWYAVVGALLWFALHHGGIHPTIAGVVVGLTIPARPRRRARAVLEDLHQHTSNLLASPVDEELDAASILHIEETLEDLEAPLHRFVHFLHPWVAFVIMPLFALANSGVDVSNMGLADLLSPVALGVMLGLLLGKPAGIMAATFIAVKAGIAERPGGAGWTNILGVTIVAGIGFTVALFIAALAYPGQAAMLDQAKVGVLVGSLLAGLAGVAVLRACRPLPQARAAATPSLAN